MDQSLPLFPPDKLAEINLEADQLLLERPQEALRLYQSVVAHIEDTAKLEQQKLSRKAMGIGAAIGLFVPGLHLLTAGLGAWIGYKLTQRDVEKYLMNTPYYELYMHAQYGTMLASQPQHNKLT